MEGNVLDLLNYEVILYDPKNLINLDDVLDELKDKFK